MNIEGYLKVPTIPGESVRAGHEDEIEVHSVGFDMSMESASGSPTRRGRVSMGAITMAKHYDRSSPYLKQALFQNKHLADVVLTIRRSTAEDEDVYLVVTLSDATVVGYQLQPSEIQPQLLEEKLAFHYGSISFRYGPHEVELTGFLQG